jgi:adenylate kinase family enzyme
VGGFELSEGFAGGSAVGRQLILVDGPAGAGKTTFAESLATGLDTPLVHLEDLYLGWAGLEGAFGRLEELVLRPWLAGSPGGFRAYDWVADSPTGRWIEVPAANCLVVEGCGCAPRAADSYKPVIIWLDAPLTIRLARVLERDGAWEEPFLKAWEAATATHFARERTPMRADLRLERRFGDSPAVS